jgi:hypothetical protein
MSRSPQPTNTAPIYAITDRYGTIGRSSLHSGPEDFIFLPKTKISDRESHFVVKGEKPTIFPNLLIGKPKKIASVCKKSWHENGPKTTDKHKVRKLQSSVGSLFKNRNIFLGKSRNL